MADLQLTLFAAPEDRPPAGPGLPDQAARDRIRDDLDANLLVEAGAGAGKTTAMVGRMVSLVRSGRAEVAQIAAVTFTRKAAAELRERFQTALEHALRDAHGKQATADAVRLDRALREIDRAFLGTIHAFCARLLRERPLDAGIDPAFRETLGSEEKRLRQRFWLSWLERLSAEGDPALAQLREAALRPQQLQPLYEELVEQADVIYPLHSLARPDAAGVRQQLERLMDRAAAITPAREPSGGWDPLQRTLQRLRFHREVLGWSRDTAFLDVINGLRPNSFKLTQNRWQDGAAAKALARELTELFGAGGAADALRRQWWAYRYPVALTFARRAAEAYAAERARAGTLNFQDLLLFAARLLRTSPAARRELGERYRYLLVDEFQDTDPIQAEVLFLLASDEELDLFEEGPLPVEWLPPSSESVIGTGHAALVSWRHLRPRAGALFVVGDPKQSIYRFRRADMTLYQQVRHRFAHFGAVLELTTNFRSREPIETFVNELFSESFPATATEEQAQFAPMRVRPVPEPQPVQGVFWYELNDPVNGQVDRLARQDASRLAVWIAGRVARGERKPGDFLLITPARARLDVYAGALEKQGVPVQVTGAGIGERHELHELRLLMRALNDPGDARLTVAVLVGLFFGIDYEQLAQHALDGGRRVAFTAALPDPQTDVERALALLNTFWRWTRSEPADVAVARIVEQLGILPLAAAADLGASRAGALLFALDAIRAAALNGDASLAGAIAALDAALEEDESEAQLEPGRRDVVRVMNLHKAKGLEAPVVVLASPFSGGGRPPTRRVVRDAYGRALGYTTVFDGHELLAQPPDWDDVHAPVERAFHVAEQDRLMYVAATRAAHELVVACAYNPNSPSRWGMFYSWLKRNGTRIELPEESMPQRLRVETDLDTVRTAVADAAVLRDRAARPGYRLAAVSDRKRDVLLPDDALEGEVAEPTEQDVVEGRGTAWGTAVHDALLAAAAGASGDRLRALCRALLTAAERPLDARGEPAELAELLATVDAVLASPLWLRARAASRMLLEAPFAVAFTAAEYAAITGRAAPEPDAPAFELLDGRIDLAFREDDGWVIVDYKSDAAGARIPAGLMQRYRAQLALYAAAWARITGEPVRETALLFTATREVGSGAPGSRAFPTGADLRAT